MKNKKVILIDGFARGGTNILWNILQSHPDVTSPMLETGEIVNNHFSFCKKASLKIAVRSIPFSIISSLVFGAQLDTILFEQKMKTLTDCDNSWKYPGVKYVQSEVKDSTLCLKSINNDIYLTALFFDYYSEICGIGLIRNGLAICEGWVRRGLDAHVLGKMYRKYSDKMIEYENKYCNYNILRFEEMVENPFSFSEKVFKLCSLDPPNLTKLRLKSKKLLDGDGSHQISFGKENAKKWFGKEDIPSAVNPNIDEIQVANLGVKEKNAFLAEAKPALKYFGYM